MQVCIVSLYRLSREQMTLFRYSVTIFAKNDHFGQVFFFKSCCSKWHTSKEGNGESCSLLLRKSGSKIKTGQKAIS